MTGYGNATDFKSYHTERGKTIPSSWTDDLITKALLLVSEWLDNRYSSLWIGYKTDGWTQEREWPREAAISQTYPSYFFADDEIPAQVVNATYEATFREMTVSGSLEVDFTPNKYKNVSISGALSVEYSSVLTQAGDVQLEIPIIQSLMKPLIDPLSSGDTSSLSGKVVRL